MGQGILVVVGDMDAADTRFQGEQGKSHPLDLDVGPEFLVQGIGGITGDLGLYNGKGEQQGAQGYEKDQGQENAQQYFAKFFDRALCFTFDDQFLFQNTGPCPKNIFLLLNGLAMILRRPYLAVQSSGACSCQARNSTAIREGLSPTVPAG